LYKLTLDGVFGGVIMAHRTILSEPWPSSRQVFGPRPCHQPSPTAAPSAPRWSHGWPISPKWWNGALPTLPRGRFTIGKVVRCHPHAPIWPLPIDKQDHVEKNQHIMRHRCAFSLRHTLNW